MRTVSSVMPRSRSFPADITELPPRLESVPGLDYHEFADVRTHASLDDCLHALGHPRLFAFSTRSASRFDAIVYRRDDALLFGSETRGLPDDVIAAIPAENRLRLPMRAGQRSLNLSNAVAVAVFEAWRQFGFVGGE